MDLCKGPKSLMTDFEPWYGDEIRIPVWLGGGRYITEKSWMDRVVCPASSAVRSSVG